MSTRHPYCFIAMIARIPCTWEHQLVLVATSPTVSQSVSFCALPWVSPSVRLCDAFDRSHPMSWEHRLVLVAM
jgi:hypothetical protein